MEKYKVKELIEIFKNPNQAWLYKDIRKEENRYRGEAYEVLESNKAIQDYEVKGIINGDEFECLNNIYKGKIKEGIEKMDALAIRCEDGVVIIPKYSKYIIDRDGKRKKIEGYWYSEYYPQYKKPIPNQLTNQEAEQIYKLIKEKERECEVIGSRGFSTSRIDETIVGSDEYHHEEWIWPEGFAEHYVLKYKVKPSEDFLKFLNWIK